MKNWKIILIAAAISLSAGLSQAQQNGDMASMKAKAEKFLSVPLTTGSTVGVTNGTTQFTTATFYGYASVSRTAAPVANTNTTYIGFSDSDHTVTNLVDSIAAGSWLAIKAPPGTKYDLKDIYFRGTTGEKIQVVYEQ